MADEAEDDDDGQGTFTQVKRNDRKKEEYIPVWRRDAKTYVYRSEVFTKYAADKWNVYFETITGKKMDFEFSPRTLPYASALECRRNLDVLLIPLMPKRPIILDLTAGSGSDFAAFALFFNFAKYHGVDFMHPKDFARFHKNVQKLTGVYPVDYPPGCIGLAGESRSIWNNPDIKIRLENTSAKKFILEYGKYVTTKLKYNLVDLVYVDPSWSGDYLIKTLDNEEYRQKVAEDVNDGEAMPTSIEHEASPDILMNWVVNEILTPMAQANPPIKCAVLVLKVRFELTSVKMQRYLNDHPGIGQHFVVLYAVQALPNILHEEMDEENGHIIIMDTLKGKKVKRKVTNKDGVNIVKGQFHWLVLKNTDYMYVNDRKAPWYDKEILESEPEPVYVLKGSTMETTFKPTYSDKLPAPTVLTKDEYMGLKTPELQAQYKQVGPVAKQRDVQLLDIHAYINMLAKLELELNEAQSTNKVDMKKIVEQIKNILTSSSRYNDKFFDEFAGAVDLRVISDKMKAVVIAYQEKTEEQTNSEKTGDTEPPIPNTKAWLQWVERRKRRSTAKGEFPSELGALLQALQGLAAR